MIRITEISVRVARTFNVGNFESLRVEAEASGAIETDTDDIETLRTMLLAEVRAGLTAAYKEFKPK